MMTTLISPSGPVGYRPHCPGGAGGEDNSCLDCSVALAQHMPSVLEEPLGVDQGHRRRPVMAARPALNINAEQPVNRRRFFISGMTLSIKR